MPLDPSLFFMGAQMQAQNQKDLQSNIASAIKAFREDKNKLPNIEAAAQTYAYKTAAGIEPTAEEVAGAKAYDMLRATEQMAGPYGGTMPKYRSIFGESIPAPSGSYTPTYGNYGQSEAMPTGGEMSAPTGGEMSAPTGGAFPTLPNTSKPKAGAIDTADQFPQERLDDEQLNALFEGNVPQGLQGNAPMPPAGAMGEEIARQSQAYGSPLDEKTRLELGRDIQKKEIEAALKEQSDIRTEGRKAANPKEYTGEQAKAASYAYRMDQAASDMQKFLASNKEAGLATQKPIGMVGSALADVPSFGVGAALGKSVIYANATPDQQKYLKAADSWIRAKLRKESGAVISDSEWMNEYKTYFPTALDTKETIQYKNKLRKDAETAIKNETGGLYELQYGRKKESGATDYKSKYGLE